jgi:hypothetical protein
MCIYTVLANPIGVRQAAAEERHVQGWPELYICTIYDRIFGDFPAKNTVYTPYIYGSGQP